METTFARFILSRRLMFKHAKGMLNIRGKEFHTCHEIFLFLAGDVQFISDKINLKLEPGMLVLIPKERFHQFIVRGSEADYERLVLNFIETDETTALSESVMTDVRVIKWPDDALRYPLDLLAKALTRRFTNGERSLLLSSMLSCLLLELKLRLNDGTILQTGSVHRITEQAVLYIEKHFSSKLTVSSIASALNVSPSELTHVFKHDLHVPIYQYIIKKRLVCAKQMFAQGERLARAAYKCGFGDYSSFYRAHIKMFGEPPSKD